MASFFDKKSSLTFSLRRLLFTGVVLALLTFSEKGWANPVDLPVHHWSYDEVERLAVMGLCSGEGLSTRPLSRGTVAEKVAEALQKVREGETEFSPEEAEFIEESLLRLSAEFAVELKEKGVSLVEQGDQAALPHRFREGPFSFSGSFASEKYFVNLKKDKTTSLLENSKGFRLRDGATGRFGFPAWATYSDLLAFSVYPRVNGRNKEDGEADFGFDEAAAKLSYRNIYFRGGQSSYWLGPGSHGTLLLTDNTRPFPSVAVGSNRPFTLPWILKYLGKWNVTYFLGRLSDKEVVQRSLLGGWRYEWFPVRWLSFATSHLVQAGGETQKENFGAVYDAFSPFKGGGENENPNHLFGGDARIILPQIAQWTHLGSGLEIYGEFYGEDTTGFYVPVIVSRLGGGGVTDLFTLPGVDFRVEWAETDARAYQHYIYTSGYRYKGEFIGHHIGPDADDIYLRLSKRFSDNITVGAYFDRERQGRSGNALPFGGVANIKNQGGADLSCRLNDRISVGAAYELEHISNFRSSSGQTATNHIVTVLTKILF